MTYNEFKKKYNGKWVDYDGQYGCQCWDLAQKYFTECLKVPASVLAGCGLVSNMLYPPKRKQLDKYFVETKNPKAGDVAIWEYGHIAIYDKKNYYFSQNPNPCKVIKITTGGVHFFTLKKYSTEYRVYSNKHWFNIAKDGETAGNKKNTISGIQIKTYGGGKTKYRAHIKGDKWLDEVTYWGSDDDPNGYAGIKGKPIDAFTCWSEHGDFKYRVYTKKYGWHPWIVGKYGTTKTTDYAGEYGCEILAIQILLI